ncbi:single-stranded DNA-binding protein [Candidatus Obscuribacterales bacterium]|nr:single-stranded DNA-binding protein [Candidatus Obscuribacterales bacterium]
MNQLNIIGNIGSEPTVSLFEDDRKVARFSVAINGYSKNKDKKPATLWVDCELWNEAADRLIKCSEKGKLTGRKIQVTGALANSHWKKKVGTQEVPMNTKYCKVRSFELLGSIKTDDSLLDDSTELDESILEPETAEPLYVNETVTEEPKAAKKTRSK